MKRIAGTDLLAIYEYCHSIQRKFGAPRDVCDLRVVDERGVVRLGFRDARVTLTTAAKAEVALREAIEAATTFGDVGRALPDLYVLHGGRIADFSGLASADQAVTLAKEELAGRAASAGIVILTAPKGP